jgi:hypothetical protein
MSACAVDKCGNRTVINLHKFSFSGFDVNETGAGRLPLAAPGFCCVAWNMVPDELVTEKFASKISSLRRNVLPLALALILVPFGVTRSMVINPSALRTPTICFPRLRLDRSGQ